MPLDTQVEGLVDDTVGPDDQVLETAGVEELLEALRSLPPDLVEVVSLAWLHELPYSEIAQALGVPVGTVKSRVSRARRLLKDVLRRDSA